MFEELSRGERDTSPSVPYRAGWDTNRVTKQETWQNNSKAQEQQNRIQSAIRAADRAKALITPGSSEYQVLEEIDTSAKRMKESLLVLNGDTYNIEKDILKHKRTELKNTNLNEGLTFTAVKESLFEHLNRVDLDTPLPPSEIPQWDTFRSITLHNWKSKPEVQLQCKRLDSLWRSASQHAKNDRHDSQMRDSFTKIADWATEMRKAFNALDKSTYDTHKQTVEQHKEACQISQNDPYRLRNAKDLLLDHINRVNLESSLPPMDASEPLQQDTSRSTILGKRRHNSELQGQQNASELPQWDTSQPITLADWRSKPEVQEQNRRLDSLRRSASNRRSKFESNTPEHDLLSQTSLIASNMQAILEYCNKNLYDDNRTQMQAIKTTWQSHQNHADPTFRSATKAILAYLEEVNLESSLPPLAQV